MKNSIVKVVTTICVILVLFSCNMNDIKKNDNTEMNNANNLGVKLKDVNSTFNYNGKLVNPMLLYEITENEVSNSENAVMSIDVSYASNLRKYKDYGNSEEFSNGDVYCVVKNIDDSTCSVSWRKILNYNGDDSYDYDYGCFSYSWLGKLNNDIHVLKTATNGGGTLSIVSLLCIKFSLQEYYNEGVKEQRIFLTKVTEEILGMPKDLNIILDKEKNNLIIHYKDGNNYDKDINKTIQF